MSKDFRRVTSADVNAELERLIEGRLIEMLSTRLPGHCMRVGDLDTEVMLAVARNLQNKVGVAAQIHVLSPEPKKGDSTAPAVAGVCAQ